MLYDASLVFYPTNATSPGTTTGTFSATTSGSYPSLVLLNPLGTAGTPQGTVVPLTGAMAYGATSTLTGTAGRGQGEDLGAANGSVVPKIAIAVTTAFSSASASDTINWQIQGSVDNSTWTTYAESGAQPIYANSSLSQPVLTVGQYILPIDLPKRPAGALKPNYYRLQAVISSSGGITGVANGGLVLSRDDGRDAANTYAANFVVA